VNYLKKYFDFEAKECNYLNFKIKVALIKNLPPRDEEFDIIRDMGFPYIEKVFKKEPLGTDVPLFVFPERWMSIQEQYYFISYLNLNPDVEKFKEVLLICSSPIIIGNFKREQIRIITFPDKVLLVPCN